MEMSAALPDFHDFAGAFIGNGATMADVLSELTGISWPLTVAAMANQLITPRQMKREVLRQARIACERNGLDNRARKQIAKAMLAALGLGAIKH